MPERAIARLHLCLQGFEKLFDVEGAEGFILFQNVVAIVDWISLLFHY